MLCCLVPLLRSRATDSTSESLFALPLTFYSDEMLRKMTSSTVFGSHSVAVMITAACAVVHRLLISQPRCVDIYYALPESTYCTRCTAQKPSVSRIRISGWLAGRTHLAICLASIIIVPRAMPRRQVLGMFQRSNLVDDENLGPIIDVEKSNLRTSTPHEQNSGPVTATCCGPCRRHAAPDFLRPSSSHRPWKLRRCFS